MDEKKPLLGSVDVSQSFKGDGDSGGSRERIVMRADGKSRQFSKKDVSKKKKHEYKSHEFKPKHLKGGDGRNLLIRHYDKNYKRLLVVPFAVLVVAVAILLASYFQTGEFFEKDVSIRGGTTVTVLQDYADLDELERFLSDEFGTAVSARRLTEAGRTRGLVLDAGVEGEESEAFVDAVKSRVGGLSEDQYSVQEIGSALGASFFSQIVTSILFAFFFMAVVVLLYFRFVVGKWIVIPSLFVIWTVLVDIVSTLAVVSLLDVKVSTAGLAAFLLLIGYSVDTDILLTMRMLKGRQDSIFDRVMSAAKTGVLMTVAGMSAVLVGLFVAQSETIKQIMLILIIGLAFDLLNTWLTNTGVLRWYMERNRYGSR